MEAAERIVALAYQSLGYFVMEGVKAGRKEADLLAIRINSSGQTKRCLHVEVHISTNPIGALRGKATLASGRDLFQGATDYFNKKWGDKGLKETVARRLNSPDVRPVFVYGRLKHKATQLGVLRKHGVFCVCISRLVRAALRANPVADLQRNIGVARILLLAEEHVTSTPGAH